jgi:hypothetical protein
MILRKFSDFRLTCRRELWCWRLPGGATLEFLRQRIHEFLRALETRPLGRELWIVEPARVRIHQQDDRDGEVS